MADVVLADLAVFASRGGGERGEILAGLCLPGAAITTVTASLHVVLFNRIKTPAGPALALVFSPLSVGWDGGSSGGWSAGAARRRKWRAAAAGAVPGPSGRHSGRTGAAAGRSWWGGERCRPGGVMAPDGVRGGGGIR